MTNQPIDPYRAYNIIVTVSGIDDAQFYFTKCSGISATANQQEYREAGNAQLTRQIPTRVHYDPVTLTYGVTGSSALWNWLTKASEGKVERKNVSISILSNDGTSAGEQWELINAWPQKWQTTELDTASNQWAITELTLVYDQLKRKSL